MAEKYEFEEIIEDIAVVNRFITRGETTPPAIPIEEADRVKAEHKLAICKVAGQFISLLTNDKVADLVLAEVTPEDTGEGRETYQTIYTESFSYWKNNRREHDQSNHNNLYIRLAKENERAKVLLGERESSYHMFHPRSFNPGTPYEDYVSKEFEEYRNRLIDLFPSSGENPWQFSRKDGVTEAPETNGWVRTNYWFSAVRNLEPSDLAADEWLFLGFIGGRGYSSHTGIEGLFRLAHRRIDSLTIYEQEAERLRNITVACNEASQLIEAALKSPN